MRFAFVVVCVCVCVCCVDGHTSKARPRVDEEGDDGDEGGRLLEGATERLPEEDAPLIVEQTKIIQVRVMAMRPAHTLI